jgi:hypothetical protein
MDKMELSSYSLRKFSSLHLFLAFFTGDGSVGREFGLRVMGYRAVQKWQRRFGEQLGLHADGASSWPATVPPAQGVTERELYSLQMDQGSGRRGPPTHSCYYFLQKSRLGYPWQHIACIG